MRTKGFTLIELLVVISIISLLSSVVLSSLNSARRRAEISAGLLASSSLQHSYGADAVGIWDFDEGSGSTANNSATNVGDSIDMTGITWVAGIKNTALHYAGSVGSGGVSFTALPAMPKFTLAAWVYNETGGDSRHSIIDPFWEIVNDQTLCIYSYGFANQYWRCSPAGSIPNDKWVFLATSWDGSIIRHYVNGKLVYTDTAVSSGVSEPYYGIGTGCCLSTRQFKGSIDEVRIYTQALGVAQIEKFYAEGLPKHEIASKL